MQVGWAADADVRYKASTGGVLTALAVSLLKTQKVAFILHVCADPNNPMRSQWVMSETPADVIKCAGSRYGPTAPLAGFAKALDKGQKFAIIAKPCDLSAVHNLAKTDARVNAFCTVRMALICGGQSKLSKSQQLLSQFNITENDLSCFRYRGHGNPGSAYIKTKDGHVFEISYNELWENENNWDLETRCKLCPDALGETADIVASDIWPGGGPSGEDAGFNGILTRSTIGNEVLNGAKDGGDLILGKTISIAHYNKFQPHQLRRKQAIKARFDARIFAGLPEIGHDGLRIPELSYAPDGSNYHRQRDGTVKRIAQGKMTE
jgi:coenzyme F420 hydrogenase subunit beta